MVVDVGSVSTVVAFVGPDEGQPMRLILEVGAFYDPAAGDNRPNDAMFLVISVPHALDLAVAVLPLGVRGLVRLVGGQQRQGPGHEER